MIDFKQQSCAMTTTLEHPAPNYTKLNIELLLPNLLKITTADPDFPWHSIDFDYIQYFEQKKLEAKGEVIQVKTTFPMMLLAAKTGNSSALGMIHFLNNVFADLSNTLNADEKKMVCSTVKKILLTFDLRFFHFVGEIATLNNLMATKKYRLKHIEKELANEKHIDFLLEPVENNEEVLVEVLNIDLDSNKIESDPVAIDKFLTYRATQKFAYKNKRLAEPVDFFLIPVLWGGYKDIEVYRQHFKAHNRTPKNVHEPLAYLHHSDGHLYFDHQFGRVGNLVRRDLVGPK
jgi:hypothetical protein